MKDNSKKCYIVYELDAFINDVKYIKEYNTLKEIEEEYKIQNARQYKTNNIDEPKKLLKNKYIILEDNYII